MCELLLRSCPLGPGCDELYISRDPLFLTLQHKGHPCGPRSSHQERNSWRPASQAQHSQHACTPRHTPSPPAPPPLPTPPTLDVRQKLPRVGSPRHSDTSSDPAGPVEPVLQTSLRCTLFPGEARVGPCPSRSHSRIVGCSPRAGGARSRPK